jgi:hypothetical protein
MRYESILWASVAAALAGCTTLEADKVSAGADLPDGSFTYSLPRTSLLVVGTVTLNACKAVQDGKKFWYPSLDISQAVTVTPVYEADPDAQYAIPYDKLRSWSKAITLSVNTSNSKTLSSLNGSISDQSGPIVLGTALAAVKIIGGLGVPTIAGGLLTSLSANGPVATEAEQKKRPAYCAEDIAKALTMIDADTAAIVADENRDASQKNSVPNPDIAKKQAEIARLQGEYGLVRHFQFLWTPKGDNDDNPASGSETVTLSRSIDLYTKFFTDWLKTDDSKAWFADSGNAKRSIAHQIVDPITIQIEISNWTSGVKTWPNASAVSTSSSTSPTQALVLRDPALATLRVCKGACAGRMRNAMLETTNDLAVPVTIALGQFGRVFQLPLKNGVFENSNLSLTLNADGSIASIGNGSSSSLATNLTTAGQIGDSISAARAAQNTATSAQLSAKTSAASYADAVNKALADCLAQQATILSLGGHPIGTCQ